jgi:hypothetical protein
MHKKLLIALGAVLVLALPASALAAATVVISPHLAPKKHGKGTHVHFKLVGSDPANNGVPAPTNTTVVHLPKGLGISTKGFPTCTYATLLSSGDSACPAKSKVGTGHSSGGVQTTTILEALTVTAFNGAPQGGNPVLLLHVQGSIPQSINIVIAGGLSRDSGKYGYKFSFTVPPIATIPGLPNGSIIEFDVNIGGTAKVKGKTSNLVTAPKTCPKGGYNWGADFAFADGETFSTTAKSAC